MSDLTEANSSDSTKVIGASAGGLESNYLAVDSNQNVGAVLKDSTGVDLKAQKVMASSLPVAIASDQSAIQVVGNVASGSADSGNPVKIGGVFNSTLPSVATGQRVDFQLDTNGRLLTSSSALPSSASKFSFGSVTTAVIAQVPVEKTAYTEVTTNAAMTIVSSSALDTALGTGARTVTVTYLDSTMASSQTVTLTLNGTLAVTSGSSNMAYIEKMVVSTVGSGLTNAGTLTLKSGATTVGTIAVGDNQTLWAHHYVPLGKISYITGFNTGTSGTTASTGGAFIIKSSTPTVANTAEVQISDTLSMPGSVANFTRTYNSPVQVVGPARLRAYVTPGSSASYTTFASFDYIDN